MLLQMLQTSIAVACSRNIHNAVISTPRVYKHPLLLLISKIGTGANYHNSTVFHLSTVLLIPIETANRNWDCHDARILHCEFGNTQEPDHLPNVINMPSESEVVSQPWS